MSNSLPDNDRASRIAAMQSLVDEARASGESETTMLEIRERALRETASGGSHILDALRRSPLAEAQLYLTRSAIDGRATDL